MEVVYQKNRQRCRSEEGLAALFLSSESVYFRDDEEKYRTANDAVAQLSDGFWRYAKKHLRVAESRQNGIRHPIYASVTAIVHRADPKLICVELILRAERCRHTILQKHLLLHFGSEGSKVIDSRQIVGKKVPYLTVDGNFASDRDGRVYELKEKYRNEK